jgi:glutathione S-transferase
MILIGQFDSPFVRRVAVTLHCYGLTYSRQPWSVFGDMDKMREVNPLVRVPALILDDGEVLVDSSAIIDHLDELVGPTRALTPQSGSARRRVLQAVALATGGMEKTMQTFFERYYHRGEAKSAEFEQRCLGQLTATLAHLEMGCRGGWYLEGPMSQADVSIGCMIGYIKLRLPDGFSTAQYPKLEKLAQRCEALDVFTQAKPASDEVVPART